MAKPRKTKQYRGPKDRYARMVMDRLRRAGEAGQIHYDPEAFSLSRRGGPELFLGRLFKAHRDARPEDREPLLQRLVRVWFLDGSELPATFDEARGDILPVLRCLDFMGRGSSARGGQGLAHRAFPGHMSVGLVIDLADGMIHVTEESLPQWGVTFEEALELAKANLRRGSGGRFKKVADGVWYSPWNDEYDSSRLLLPDLLDGHEVKGELVAMAPRRDILLLTGTEHPLGLGYMAHLGGACLDDAKALCPVPLLRDGDGWLPYQPPPEHPAYLPLRLLRGQWVAAQYNGQMDRLNAGFRERGEAAAAARTGVLLHPDENRADTLCDWPDGGEVLLSRADVVQFSRGGASLGECAWERVVEVMGDALEPQGFLLERFRVRHFPTPEQLGLMCG